MYAVLAGLTRSYKLNSIFYHNLEIQVGLFPQMNVDIFMFVFVDFMLCCVDTTM